MKEKPSGRYTSNSIVKTTLTFKVYLDSGKIYTEPKGKEKISVPVSSVHPKSIYTERNGTKSVHVFYIINKYGCFKQEN